jgi:hypothetical protein
VAAPAGFHYAHEKGRTMMGGFTAPAKRVGFLWHWPSDAKETSAKLFQAKGTWRLRP